MQQVDPPAKVMRFKSWPYYEDWCEIFGKDRATGENSESFVDAVNNVLNGPTVEVKLLIIDIFSQTYMYEHCLTLLFDFVFHVSLRKTRILSLKTLKALSTASENRERHC